MDALQAALCILDWATLTKLRFSAYYGRPARSPSFATCRQAGLFGFASSGAKWVVRSGTTVRPIQFRPGERSVTRECIRPRPGHVHAECIAGEAIHPVATSLPVTLIEVAPSVLLSAIIAAGRGYD